ncbi:DNA polymerase IV [Candidatus Woesearchaeota archaeon]|nr:DNA polymerase IV [Candidatus Woesearchaeota archaeon]
MRIVFHIDMDAFFTAVEERENPSLKGKPVVVGADPKGGGGRGVVSTANYSARKFGIRSGMPISRAYRLCPTATFLPVNMRLYWEASQKVMAILRKQAENFQQASVDEAFFELNVRTYKQAEQAARRIKKEILEKEKLTCSIGIGPNKLVAKMASEHQKPDGLTVVKPEEVIDFLHPLPVRKLYGVGPKTEYALNSMGIKTIGDIAKQRPEKLQEIFGKWGIYMHSYAHGVDDSLVEEREEAKSVGREVTFEKDTDDEKLLRDVIDAICEDAYNASESEGYSFRTVVLKIRFEDFETHTKQKTLKLEKSLADVKKAATDLLSFYSKPKKRVRLIGVRLTNMAKK